MPKKKQEKQSLEETLKELDKIYGKGTTISLDDSKCDENYEVISTGSIAFDYEVLGVGGFIKGKIYEIRAWEGAGKTTVAAVAAANCQKKGGKVAYIDSEHAVDTKYFKALGVDLKNLMFYQPGFGEEGFDVVEKLILTGEVDLVIIDSDSSLIPKAVIENPMEASNIGKKARLNSTAYPRLKIASSNNNCCIIIISQYREKIGVMFGDPKTTQGGHALKYVADVIIEMSKKLSKDGTEAVGNDSKVKTIKNKIFPPYRECRFDIVFGEGIDTLKEIIELGIDYEILNKSGSWYSYNGDKIAQGEVGMKELLRDNPELTDELREKIISKITSTPLTINQLEEHAEATELS